MSKRSIPSIVSKIRPTQLTRRYNPLMADIVTTFGKRAMATVGSEDVFRVNRRVSNFIRAQQGALIRVNRTTQKRIGNLIAQKVEAGHSVDQIARAVKERFIEMSQGRADTIARTATTEGSSFASVEGYRQAGVEEKEWLTTVSGDSRASHVAMDGQIVGITENFESGDGGTAPYPGGFGDPSEDCNCECAVLPVVSEKRLSSRAMILKAFERLRAPHRRAMRSAMGKAFAAQSDAVVAAIREYDDVAEAA